MVELVLRRARGIPLEVVADVVAVEVLPLEPDRDRALDGREDALERQAALVVGLDLVAGDGDDRIDDGRVLFLGAGAEDEEPLDDADLCRGKPDADRVDHQRRHPLGEPPEIVVEGLDRLRLHPQDRVRVLPDLRQRQPPPRIALGLQLFVADLFVDVGHRRAH